jgi:hypothetical protein
MGVVGCVYPNEYEPSASADPEDHPLGCDYAQPQQPTRGLSNLTYFAQASYPIWNFYAELRSSLNVGPREYTGYTVSQLDATDPAGGAHLDAYAFWMGRAIVCPSGGLAC